ncbi:MAG: chemotaxis protein CheA [Deltaproteobacteria bacterium]|jgi:two-component system chemotaxis sensor kinase CheA|nr:chemotaxis protein CheA [Deltaproteobacteria bacterium]
MSVSDENLAELFEQYKDEVRETIGTLDNELVAIEQDPSSSETIFSLFRHMHSLKGSSKMFNVDNIANIAHRLEDLMSMIDKNNAILSKYPKIIDLLFKGNDIFRDIIAKLEDDISYTTMTVDHVAFVGEIQTQIDKINRRDSQLVDSARKLIEDLEALLPAMEEMEIEHLKKDIHEVNNGLAIMTLEEDGSSQIRFNYNGADITEEVRAMEELVGKFKEEKASPEDGKLFLEAANRLYNSLADVAQEDAMSLIAELGDGLSLFTERRLEMDQMMVEFFAAMLKELKEKFQVEVETTAVKTSGPAKSSAAAKEPQVKTIRVDEAKIDLFLDSVGKLITKSEILNHLQFSFRQAGIDTSLLRDFSTVSRTISNDIVNLQRSIMEVRQVEMNNILKKFPRLVRDISHKIGKEAEMLISGERVPIDKSLLDDVEQAMVHIVRNAVDHGLESPDEREASGKNRRGIVNISVTSEEASIYIEVSDDGRGLDLDKIKSKALERGVVSEDQAETMSDKDAAMLIFNSGLSTKDQATDLSGRGVGMDVVMTNLKKWNGEVIVDNRPGQGLTVGLRLPVTNTLLTKEAIMLRVGTSTFCLPLEFVNEIVTVPSEAVHHHKEGAVFRHRDMVISVIDLKGLLGLTDDDGLFLSGLDEPLDGADGLQSPDKKEFIFIILRGKSDSRQSIRADEILGQQKIVIKEFELETFRRLPYFNGLTLLGDGRVVLILDSEKLLDS